MVEDSPIFAPFAIISNEPSTLPTIPPTNPRVAITLPLFVTGIPVGAALKLPTFAEPTLPAIPPAKLSLPEVVLAVISPVLDIVLPLNVNEVFT